MNQVPTNQILFKQQFSSVDQLCESVRNWDLEFRQLERGRFNAEIFQIISDQAFISEARFGRALHQLGTAPPGVITFAIPAIQDLSIKWRGHKVQGTDVMIFPHSGELDSVSDENFHVFTCSFSEETLGQICEEAELINLKKLIKESEVVRLESAEMYGVTTLLKQALSSIRSSSGSTQNSTIWSDLQQELPRLILQGLSNSYLRNSKMKTRISSRRLELVEQAQRIITRYAYRAITVSELTELLNVSQRTLEYAFQDRYQTTVKNYILGYRLFRTRQELLRSDSSEKRVTDIANRWGFWHMGQFAADYQAFFGERPSTTLKQGESHNVLERNSL